MSPPPLSLSFFVCFLLLHSTTDVSALGAAQPGRACILCTSMVRACACACVFLFLSAFLQLFLILPSLPPFLFPALRGVCCCSSSFVLLLSSPFDFIAFLITTSRDTLANPTPQATATRTPSQPLSSSCSYSCNNSNSMSSIGISWMDRVA